MGHICVNDGSVNPDLRQCIQKGGFLVAKNTKELAGHLVTTKPKELAGQNKPHEVAVTIIIFMLIVGCCFACAAGDTKLDEVCCCPSPCDFINKCCGALESLCSRIDKTVSSAKSLCRRIGDNVYSTVRRESGPSPHIEAALVIPTGELGDSTGGLFIPPGLPEPLGMPATLDVPRAQLVHPA